MDVLKDLKCEQTFTRLWRGFADKECMTPDVVYGNDDRLARRITIHGVYVSVR